MRDRADRRAFLFALLLAAVARAAAAEPRAASHGPARPGRRRLDLRLGREELRRSPENPELPALGPSAGPPEPLPRSGLAVELRQARREREAASAGSTQPVERDALAEGLDRLGLEEFVIRFVRPL